MAVVFAPMEQRPAPVEYCVKKGVNATDVIKE